MSVDKLVDSSQLDTDLTSVANAIRAKSGGSSQLAFPAGFVSEIQAIPTGVTPTGTKQISITQNGTTTEDVTNYANAEITVNVSGETTYYTSSGMGYAKNTVNPATSLFNVTYLYSAANSMETIEFPNFSGVPSNYTFVNCANLKSIRFLGSVRPANSNFVRYTVASKLQEVQLGSVGHPAKSDAKWSTAMFGFFGGGTKPTITVYVNAETLADVPDNIKANQPWNASGSTVVYRSSNTGEVLV